MIKLYNAQGDSIIVPDDRAEYLIDKGWKLSPAKKTPKTKPITQEKEPE